MKAYDLDGNIFKWNLSGYQDQSGLHKSDLHLQARKLLKEIYPTLILLEEVTVPIKRGCVVYLDFYLPVNKLCVEVHGKQHYEFSTLFHATRADFLNQKKRDREKKQWLELNGISYIELPYNKVKDWENILRGRSTEENNA